MLKCRIRCSWPIWNGYCPSEGIDWCVWISCTMVVRVLSGPDETEMSKKGREPSWLDSSVVNWMCGSCQMICWRCCLCVSLVELWKCCLQTWAIGMGGGGRVYGLDFKLFHEQVEGAYRGTHGCTMDLFVILTLQEEVHVFVTKP